MKVQRITAMVLALAMISAFAFSASAESDPQGNGGFNGQQPPRRQAVNAGKITVEGLHREVKAVENIQNIPRPIEDDRRGGEHGGPGIAVGLKVQDGEVHDGQD